MARFGIFAAVAAVVAATSAQAELSFDPAEAIKSVSLQERASFGALAPGHLSAISALAPKASIKPPAKPEDLQILPSREWLAKQPAASGGEQWACLTEALYFEARGESHEGVFAVAEVILNRVDSPKFPDTVCGVVNQGTGRKHACQFSFTCDGRPEVVNEPKSYKRMGKVARVMMDGDAPRVLTGGATFYHTTGVQPSWAARLRHTAQIGVHKFYR